MSRATVRVLYVPPAGPMVFAGPARNGQDTDVPAHVWARVAGATG